MQKTPGEIKLVTDRGAVNLQWSAAFLGVCRALGLRHLVLSPGSRSTPLVLAAEYLSGVRIHVQPDERAAAFFALGLAKAAAAANGDAHRSGTAVAVLATSGSAAANWFPAVVESSLGGTPLLLFSADRPQEMHYSGANQTIEQSSLFGDFVRQRMHVNVEFCDDAEARHARDLAARAMDAAQWPRPGPVHINIGFKEPLVPAEWPEIEHDAADDGGRLRYGRVRADDEAIADAAGRLTAGCGVIICGPDTPTSAIAPLTRLADKLDCPILADMLSGVRFGDHDRSRVITRYDALLRAPNLAKAWGCDWILHLGSLPVSGKLQDFSDAQPWRVWIAPQGDWPDPQHAGGMVIRAHPCEALVQLYDGIEPQQHADWLDRFVRADTIAAKTLESMDQPPLAASVMQCVQELIPADACLFVGNSMVARDADAFLAGGAKRATAIGNRGASGIDGNVSTALGVAAGCNHRVVALLGDLAFFHDMTGLLMARHSNAIMIVFNNGGGEIFRYLPQTGLPQLEEHWVCDTGIKLDKIAAAYGLDHARATDHAGFDSALTACLDKPHASLIEIVIDADQSVALHRSYWQAVASAAI